MAASLKLPVIVGDSVLRAYFPYEYVPHEVWLDGSLKLQAVTSAEYITEVNIRRVLRSGWPEWFVKKDLGNYRFSERLLKLTEQENFTQPLFYSALSGARKGTLTASKTILDAQTNTKRITYVNRTIPQLVRLMLPDKPFIQNNRFVLNVEDPSRFFFNGTTYLDEWQADNTFTYEAILPINSATAILKNRVKNDLQDFFSIEICVENRLQPCYILKSITASAPIKNEKFSLIDNTDITRFKSAEDLVQSLDYYAPVPLINEALDKKYPPLKLPGALFSKIEELNPILEQYGLVFIRDQRWLNMIVITERREQ
ncbi:MAG: hypothetical protein ACO1OO_12945 [Flavisolibacter sp.]